ncbi:hypothetical protein E2C01_018761 [Portunus trituberculatus]|uniref:Uncharacterized protein n=1 Tax=Portunus trituberculatus TaxID=210409 RepID=A0A5B7DVX0_PORTR|nr:hypothetical protein [Portunus trituberculatus]
MEGEDEGEDDEEGTYDGEGGRCRRSASEQSSARRLTSSSCDTFTTTIITTRDISHNTAERRLRSSRICVGSRSSVSSLLWGAGVAGDGVLSQVMGINPGWEGTFYLISALDIDISSMSFIPHQDVVLTTQPSPALPSLHTKRDTPPTLPSLHIKRHLQPFPHALHTKAPPILPSFLSNSYSPL